MWTLRDELRIAALREHQSGVLDVLLRLRDRLAGEWRHGHELGSSGDHEVDRAALRRLTPGRRTLTDHAAVRHRVARLLRRLAHGEPGVLERGGRVGDRP